MDIIHYQGLLRLTIGVSLFIIILLTLRLISLKRLQAYGFSGSDRDSSSWQEPEELHVVEVLRESRDIVSIRLRRADGRLFPPFKAGQFLSLQIGLDPKRVRSYSISSSATRRSVLQISVKKVPGGLGSTWVHELRAGDKVTVYPPNGHFTDETVATQNVVYVAGGVGVTPMVSMIESRLDRGDLRPIYLFYGVRTQLDLAFYELLSLLSSRHKNFVFKVFVSQDSEWQGQRGVVTVDAIREVISQLGASEYFVCGPDAMMNSISKGLQAEGVLPERIHTERFVSPVSLDRSAAFVVEADIRVGASVLKYKGKESLLEFLESQGVNISYACRSGVCGSCKCRVRGRLTEIVDSGLSPEDKRNGYILACVSFPEGDIDIDQIG